MLFFFVFFWDFEQNRRARGLKTDHLFYEALFIFSVICIGVCAQEGHPKARLLVGEFMPLWRYWDI